MVSPLMPPSPANGPQPGVGNIGYAVKLAMKFFLEPKHYRRLLRILSEQWNSCHSLTAAIRLMEAHGVKIEPQEEELLKQLPEDRMIEALVQRMPQHSREQFEHFFLQLSFVASTTTRLRTALEEGQPEAIEEALESAENVGVLSYLLKMTIFQAGQEVKLREDQHETWLAETNDKMAPLLSTSVAAMAVQKDLAQAKSTIENYHGDAKNKSRGVMQNMSEANMAALGQNVFIAWNAHVRKIKVEQEVKAEYQDQIDEVNKKLFEMREAQLVNVKKVLQKQSGAAMDSIMLRCLDALKAEEAQIIARKESAAEGEELMAKISNFSQTAAHNAQNVMSRMNAGNSNGLKQMAWLGWKGYMEEFKQDEGLSKSLREKEAQVEAFKNKQKSGARSVVTNMTTANNEAFKHTVYTAWLDMIKERKEAERVSSQLNQKASQMGNFQSKNKAAGMSASEKTAYLQDAQLLIYTMCQWKKDARVERIRRMGKEKDTKRKKELVGVKGMFKNFASELENSLMSGTPRVEVKPKRAPQAELPPAPEAKPSKRSASAAEPAAAQPEDQPEAQPEEAQQDADGDAAPA